MLSTKWKLITDQTECHAIRQLTTWNPNTFIQRGTDEDDETSRMLIYVIQWKKMRIMMSRAAGEQRHRKFMCVWVNDITAATNMRHKSNQWIVLLCERECREQKKRNDKGKKTPIALMNSKKSFFHLLFFSL